MAYFLLEDDSWQRISQLGSSGLKPAQATTAQTSVAGKIGKVYLTGALSDKPSFWQTYFGVDVLTYSGVVDALQRLEDDKNVTDIEMVFDSVPGGTVAGLYQAIEKISTFQKPRTAVIQGMCASAGYALACTCQKITASSRADLVGSIGTRATYYVSENVVDITSTGAENKAPDPSTAEGKAAIVKQLDMLQSMFDEQVMKGRGVSKDKILSHFGRGGLLLASAAVECGMIDGIAEELRHDPKQETQMIFSEARVQFAADIDALVQQAVKSERERVSAHLAEAQESGFWKQAVEDVESGAAYSAKTVKAHAKFIKESLVKDRRQESAPELQPKVEARPEAQTDREQGDLNLAASAEDFVIKAMRGDV